MRGFSALEIGEAVFTTGLFQVCAIPFYTVLARRIDLRWLMMFGLACFALSMWNFTPITHDWGWRELLLPQAFRGFSQQFAVAPTVTLTLGGLAPERLKLASGLFNLMRNLGGAIGIAVCGTILNDRTNLHFLRLAEHLNSRDSAMLRFVQQVATSETAARGGDALHGACRGAEDCCGRSRCARRRRRPLPMRSSSLPLCFVVATCMVPLMRKMGAPVKPTADAH